MISNSGGPEYRGSIPCTRHTSPFIRANAKCPSFTGGELREASHANPPPEVGSIDAVQSKSMFAMVDGMVKMKEGL